MVIRTRNSGPVVLVESAVIINYIVDHFGADSDLTPRCYLPGNKNVVGSETAEWKRHCFFMEYPEGSLMPFVAITFLAGSTSTCRQ